MKLYTDYLSILNFHKFTEYDLFSTLQALYILILLIMPHATCDKREKCKKVKANFDINGKVKSLYFTAEKFNKVEFFDIQNSIYEVN